MTAQARGTADALWTRLNPKFDDNPRTAHIPVIIVTALDQPSDRVAGLEAGADDFLTKPVNDIALITRVKSLVRLKVLTDELLPLKGQCSKLKLGLLCQVCRHAPAGSYHPVLQRCVTLTPLPTLSTPSTQLPTNSTNPHPLCFSMAETVISGQSARVS